MKKILFLLASTLLCNIIISQKVTITKGTEFRSEDGKFDSYINNDANGIYVLRYKQKATSVAYFIQKIDPKTLLPVYTTPYEGSTSQMYLVKDKFLAFSSTYDKKEQIKYFLLDEFDVKTGKKNWRTKTNFCIKNRCLGGKRKKFLCDFFS